MKRRTTLEIDEELLQRAKRVLGCDTRRATVEEALRRAAEQAENEASERKIRELAFLSELPSLIDVRVLASEEMWR